MRYLAILLLAACAAATKPVETELACQRVLASLRADRAAGVTCEAAKARALAQEPACPLAFTCPSRLDGGAE